MNISKLHLGFLAVVCLTGCGDEKISCTTPEVLDLLREVYTQGNPGFFYPEWYQNEIKLLRNAGVDIPEDKYYHEDNEDYLAVQNSVKITFDNIITNRINTETQAHSCTTDILFNLKDQHGETLNFSVNGISFNAFYMNGGEKFGIEYDRDSAKNSRNQLLKEYAEIAGLDNPAQVIFSKEELKLITEQKAVEEARAEKAKKDEDSIRKLVNEFSANNQFNELIYQNVESLIANKFFNGNLEKNSHALIELYSINNNLDLAMLSQYEKLLQGVDINGYNITESQANAYRVINTTNGNITQFVQTELSSQFKNKDFRTQFCEQHAPKLLGSDELEQEIALKACERLYEKYNSYTLSTEIPMINAVLRENGLIFKLNSASADNSSNKYM